MKYQIIFVDIDWTILDHNKGDFDYDSINKLIELQKEGLLVFLNTARPYDSIYHTGLLKLFHPDGIISTNGGVGFIKDKLLYENIIPEDIVRSIEKTANKHHLVLELSKNKERHFTNKRNKYVDNYFSIFKEVIPCIKKYDNKGINSILLFAPAKYDETLKKELPKDISLLRFDSHGVDLGYYKNNKGYGVEQVLNYYHIDKEKAIAVGDSYDDIAMFKKVGLSICMGNGTDEAKKEADITAPNIGISGLKIVLEEIFGK